MYSSPPLQNENVNRPITSGEVVPPDDSESEREASYVLCGYHCILLIALLIEWRWCTTWFLKDDCIEASYYVIVVIIINSLIYIAEWRWGDVGGSTILREKILKENCDEASYVWLCVIIVVGMYKNHCLVVL